MKMAFSSTHKIFIALSLALTIFTNVSSQFSQLEQQQDPECPDCGFVGVRNTTTDPAESTQQVPPPAKRLPTHFIFALQWPASTCNDADPQKRKCLPNYPTGDFTIHGLWPKDLYGYDPTVNSPEPTFDKKNLDTSLLASMTRYWPNLIGDNVGFWTHEWYSHGVYAIWKQKEYFALAVNGFTTLKLLQRLDNAGLRPGPAPLQLNTIEKQVTQSLNGRRAQIVCNEGTPNGQLQIQEIRINSTYDQTRKGFTFQDNTSNHKDCKQGRKPIYWK